MIETGIATRHLSGHQDSRNRRPGQGVASVFRCSPDSFATIPVSKGMMPDFMLARLAIVLENGHADPGTGHTPTSKPGGNQLSRSPILTKIRLETRMSNLQPLAPRRPFREARPGCENGADGGIKVICT